MAKKLLKIFIWSFLWLLFVWTFLIISFPAKTAKDWLIDSLGKGLNAKVSIDELHLRWNLEVKLKGISVVGANGHTPLQDSSAESGLSRNAFNVQLASLNIKPGILSLIRLKPEIAFDGNTPSDGNFSGSYASDELNISFKNISFKDFSISALPVPSAASVSGSGRLKSIKGKGMIEIEMDGIPGGKQRVKVSGGDGPGLDGKLKVSVSLSKL